MEERKNHEELYRSLFGQALQKIKLCRDPHDKLPEIQLLGWNTVEQQEMFDLGFREISAREAIARDAKAISIDCFSVIVKTLFHDYGYEEELFVVPNQEENGPQVIFGIHLKREDTLLLFKEMESSPIWKNKSHEPEDVNKLLKSKKVSCCKYVYLMFDKAYMQVIGHDDNEDDPGRGYNLYSVKWLFETYFGSDECNCFMKYVKAYIREAKNYLGFIQMRALTPNAMTNFHMIAQGHFLQFDFRDACTPITNRFDETVVLEESSYRVILEQFLERKHYMMMVGTKDFAESFVTAEWLRDSMSKAGAIDLTAIGVGYFKAVEQLMYELIYLYRNNGLEIKSATSKKQVALDDANIENCKIDTSLGSMALYYKKSLDIFPSNVDYKAKTYIREALFDYANMRNDYLHKKNIHDMARINEIRVSTFRVIFLLLGSHEFDEASEKLLGMPDLSFYDDYYKMCEYVNYHTSRLYMVDAGNGDELLCCGCPDPYAHIVEGRYVVYSGFYLKELPTGTVYQFKKEHMPRRIWLGSLGISPTANVHFEPKRKVKLFEDGRYVGPNLVEEKDLDY